MISQTAIEYLEELKEAGLDPSFADTIRLNALGLKLEAARKKGAADSLYYLPRLAAISPTVYFRQPAVGHEIWLSRVEHEIAPRDLQTVLAIKAYALSRDPADLPNANDIAVVQAAIEDFLPSLAEFTRDQIYAAIEYVIFGASPILGERPPPEPADPDASPDMCQGEDWHECIALGVLHEGHVALWGMTRADMEKMTRRQLEEEIRRAYIFHGFNLTSAEKDAEGAFFAALEEIRARLTKQKENQDGK